MCLTSPYFHNWIPSVGWAFRIWPFSPDTDQSPPSFPTYLPRVATTLISINWLITPLLRWVSLIQKWARLSQDILLRNFSWPKYLWLDFLSLFSLRHGWGPSKPGKNLIKMEILCWTTQATCFLPIPVDSGFDGPLRSCFPWIPLSAGIQQSSLPAPTLHLQHGWTCELISSCPIAALHAAAGLLCSPFMSHSIPIIIPRSTIWLTHSGSNRGFPEAKAAWNEYFFLLWLFFIAFSPPLCVNLLENWLVWVCTSWDHSSFLLILLGKVRGGPGSSGMH